jgi:hypothetical protein
VSAPIIRHGNWEDNYDDPSHPIPSMSALDVHVTKKGGGSDLIIVVASPLQADTRSLQRLLDKVDIYLRYIRSLEYEKECGPPSPENTCIIVRLHPGSDALILDLLERCKPWVAENFCNHKVAPLDEPIPASSNNRWRGL